jgi:hypothetical protein
VLPRVFYFAGWDAAERSRSILCLVVASNEVAASIAFPKRQRVQVISMLINLPAIG